MPLSRLDIVGLQKAYGALRCLLYTSDAADERSSVDLGGRRIIKKKKIAHFSITHIINYQNQYEDHAQNRKITGAK